jgi:hypothetical protein
MDHVQAKCGAWELYEQSTLLSVFKYRHDIKASFELVAEGKKAMRSDYYILCSFGVLYTKLRTLVIHSWVWMQ